MQENQLIITKATINDAAQLTELSISTFREAFGPDNTQADMDKYLAEEMNQEKLRRELQDPSNIFFLAAYNGVLAGYIKLRTTATDEVEAKKPIEIERLYVASTHQNKRIGEALINHCITLAMLERHDVIWLGVWERNHHAIRFYERMGFVLFGSHPFLLGNDMQTDVLMKKALLP